MHIKNVHMLIMVWLKCTKKLKNGNKKWLDQLPNIVFNICKYRKITCPNRLDKPLRKIFVFALCTEYIRKETWYIFSSVNLNFDRFQLTKSGCTILICMQRIYLTFYYKRWPPYCTIKRLYDQTRGYNTVWYIFQGFNTNCSQFLKL